MATRWMAIAALAVLGGCAGLQGQEECTADWYDVGRRDAALFRIRPQTELYQARCSERMDAAAYERGWREGYGERRSSGL